METMISPKFTNKTFGSNPTIEDKILVFEDREFGWRIVPAEDLKDPDAGYAIISVLFSYFEMIHQYISGKSSIDKSKLFFRKGFKDVYPDTDLKDDEINLIYSRVRCGMYHSGMTKVDTLLSGDYEQAATVKSNVVMVNPHRLVEDVRNHLQDYIAKLREEDQTELRNNFQKTFDRNISS